MANLSLESLLTSSPALVAPAETAAKRLKSEQKSRDWFTMSYEELKALYDDASEPRCVMTPEFTYRNKAAIKQQELDAEYKRQNRGRGPFGERVEPPPNTAILGGVHAHRVTDDNRPRLVQCSKIALEKYNADNNGANFEFVELVRCNMALVHGYLYYITFEAKDAADGATHTFQAKVWYHFGNKKRPEALMCQMKPN